MSVEAINNLFNLDHCDHNFQLVIKLASTATPRLNDLYIVYARKRVFNLDGTLAEEATLQHVCEGFIDSTFPTLRTVSSIPVNDLLEALDAWGTWKVSGAILYFGHDVKFTIDKENLAWCSLMRWIELCTSISLL